MPSMPSRCPHRAGKTGNCGGEGAVDNVHFEMETLADHLSSLREELAEINNALTEGNKKYEEYSAISDSERTEEQKQFLEDWPEEAKKLQAQETEKTQSITYAEAAEQEALAALAEQGEDFSYESAEEAVAGLQGKMQELLAREQTLLAGEQELLAYGQQIEDGKAQLAAARQTLEDSKQQIDAGQAQIDAAWGSHKQSGKPARQRKGGPGGGRAGDCRRLVGIRAGSCPGGSGDR